jgi:hypothetical protein
LFLFTRNHPALFPFLFYSFIARLASQALKSDNTFCLHNFHFCCFSTASSSFRNFIVDFLPFTMVRRGPQHINPGNSGKRDDLISSGDFTGGNFLLIFLFATTDLMSAFMAQLMAIRMASQSFQGLGIVGEDPAARPHLEHFHGLIRELICTWGLGALPDDVRFALHDVEEVLGLPLTQFNTISTNVLVHRQEFSLPKKKSKKSAKMHEKRDRKNARDNSRRGSPGGSSGSGSAVL